MASDYEDYCETWAENTEVLMEDESLTPDRFCLVFHVSFISLPEEEDEEDEVLEINNLVESAIETKAFWVTRDQLMNNDTSQETLEQIFSSMQVPSRPVFVEKILGCARSMANDKTTYDEFKILRMHVRMCVVVVDADDDDDDDDDDEDEDEEVGTVGASKESIERLERVTIDDKEEMRGPCAICLQKFLFGLQVTRLPNCCHIFHGDCILNWLNRSKVCPLCRNEIN